SRSCALTRFARSRRSCIRYYGVSRRLDVPSGHVATESACRAGLPCPYQRNRQRNKIRLGVRIADSVFLQSNARIPYICSLLVSKPDVFATPEESKARAV